MGETMREKKDISYTIRRSADFPVIMIGEGILVGAVAGGIVLLYRICLNYAGTWMRQILEMCKGDPLRSALWIGALLLMAVVTGLLVRWEPMISGSGIPQLKGEMEGKLEQRWYRILPAKFLGGFLGMFGGLALGREGPSIQLGAMAGKGIYYDRGRNSGGSRCRRHCAFVPDLPELCGDMDASDFGDVQRRSAPVGALDRSASSDGGCDRPSCPVGADDFGQRYPAVKR